MTRVSLALAALLLCLLSGCGEDSGSSLQAAHLDRELQKPPYGQSADEVRAQLGEPTSEFASPGEGSLTYASWRLIFVNDELVRLFHELHRTLTDLNEGDPELDRRVYSLKQGTSVGLAEKLLGAPEVREELFESNHVPIAILRYGRWEIQFEHQRMTFRTRN